MFQWASENLPVSALVFARIAALLWAMPSITSILPYRIKLAFAFLITALIVPSLETTVSTSLRDIEFAVLVGREVFIGLMMGTTVQLLVMGIQMGAEVTSSSGALPLGSSPDSASGESVPSLARFVGLMVVATMFAIGGHRVVLSLLKDSMTALPPGEVGIHESMMTLIVQQFTAGMSAGLRIAAPVIAALLFMNLLIGIISRSIPQLNVLAVGLSANAIALLIVTTVTIGSVGLVFQNELAATATRLTELWSQGS